MSSPFCCIFVVYTAFQIRWYVLTCYFHVFWSFLGKNPPCCVVLFVSEDSGTMLHVFSMVSEIFCIIWSI